MFYALLVVLVSGAVFLRGATSARRRQAIPAAARTLGFTADLSAPVAGCLTGTYAGFRTRLRFVDGGSGQVAVEMSPVASGIVLAAKGRNAPAPSAAVFSTGDPAFDDEVSCEGSAATLLALLDPDVRLSLAMHTRELRIRAEDGVVSAVVPEGAPTPQALVAALDLVATVASHLVPDGPPAARLRERAMRDPLPEVRRKAFEVMESALPDSPEARAAALSGVVDSDPAVALAAARVLGPDGHDALAGLAANELLPVALRVDALTAVRARLPPEARRTVCKGLLRALRPAVRAGAIAELASLGARELLPEIRACVHGAGGDPEEDRAIAEALGVLADDANEAPLLVLLRREDVDVARAAARALGSCGTAASIESLHAAGAGSRDLADACEQATVAIRARLVGAAPGQLQLAVPGDARGEVSVAESADGALTVAPGSRERSR